jgi:beta-lactamase regulating signal transducer with metallopeptidase domain
VTLLANHLLQSTLFAFGAALLAFAFRNNHARTRHLLWMAASIKFLLPFSVLVWLGSQISAPPPAPVPQSQLTFVMSVPRNEPATRSDRSRAHTSAPAPDWSKVLWTVYFCGSAAILIRWRLRWEKVARAARNAQLAGEVSGVKMLSSQSISEPGVFGVFRPVLLLPSGIEERLSRAQLEAVIAHEVAHVRRRDNLMGAIHMGVEALFWFYPLVWWIGARLVDERELACDEEVLRLGADRETYAAGIIEVCRLTVETPVACMSCITGSDLQARITSIMSAPTPQPVRILKRLLLFSLSVGAVAVPFVTGVLHPLRAHAQEAPRTAPARSFEVASVKMSTRTFANLTPERSGGRFTWIADLQQLIEYAYHVELWRISGDIPDQIYAVEATSGPDATVEEVRLML